MSLKVLTWQEASAAALWLAAVAGVFCLDLQLPDPARAALWVVLAVGLPIVLRRFWSWLLGPLFVYDLVRTARRNRLIPVRLLYALLMLLIISVTYSRWFGFNWSDGGQFFEPPVILGLTMPGLIWAVLMIMFFGLNETSAYAAVAITIMPMLAISIWQGTKSIDKDLVDMSKIFHASPWSKVIDVILPQLISHILAAIRYGLGLAWKVVVVVEMFGLSNGVGYQVVRGFNVFSMKAVLAWAISFLVVMIIIEFGIIGWLERAVTRWRPRVEAWRR